jgi:hypothetical protein
MSTEAELQKLTEILHAAVGQVSKAIGENYAHSLSKIEDLQEWPPEEVARRYQAIPAMLAFLNLLQESELPESLSKKAEGAFNGQTNPRKGLEAAFQTICAQMHRALQQEASYEA